MAGKKKNGRRREDDGLLSFIDRVTGGIGLAGVSLVRFLLFAFRGLLRVVYLAARFCVMLPFRLFSRLLAALRSARDPAERCLRLSGEEFEAYCARVLRSSGFRHVELTPAGGDQGVDILAVRGGESWAVQCKNYSGAVGNFAVQEVAAGQVYYGCDRAAVLCPGSFTRAARELAEANGVDLWDGQSLSRMIRRHGKLP
ncbi:MAG: restriction endonuclease [Clostridiales bacterium]|nr:restriction endonuclease [Clostridiales bacterium]